jgi:hypothetical protein
MCRRISWRSHHRRHYCSHRRWLWRMGLARMVFTRRTELFLSSLHFTCSLYFCLVIARYTHDTHGRGRAFAFGFIVVLVSFYSFFLFFCFWKGGEEAEEPCWTCNWAYGQQSPLRNHESLLEWWRGRRGGRGYVVVHVDTLERGADKGRERGRMNNVLSLAISTYALCRQQERDNATSPTRYVFIHDWK